MSRHPQAGPNVQGIGGGLAGCEAAWQLARRGVAVRLSEMRPGQRSPAHVTDALAELVCSNSFRGASLENAVGLLKEELARLDSLIVTAGRDCAVPAGGALAVDRERFSAEVERRLLERPEIEIVREEVTEFEPEQATIVACGPLPSQALCAAIDRVLERVAPSERTRLHYYDAASPIVASESLDQSAMYRKSRYDKGDGDDYLNVPLTREQYETFVNDLRSLPKHDPKEFELDAAAGKVPYFEGCLPIEELALRGEDTLRYGPMKPVGLRHPETGALPYRGLCSCAKRTSAAARLTSLAFKRGLTWPAQKEAFGKLPGFANVEFLRLGVMHRNAFLNAPRLLQADLRLRGMPRLWFAGQITGAEGYVEAAACGAMAGIAAARALRGLEPVPVPADTALGAVVAATCKMRTRRTFQPSNVTWSAFSPARRRACAARQARASPADGRAGRSCSSNVGRTNSLAAAMRPQR